VALEGGEGGEVTVGGPELVNAVVETEGRDAGVVDFGSLDFASEGEVAEFVEVSGAFSQEPEGGTGLPGRECVEGYVRRSGRAIDFGVGDDGEEFMKAWPRDRPWLAGGGECVDLGEGGLVPWGILAMAVDEDVGVDGDHA
jgi:hypothetical protein